MSWLASAAVVAVALIVAACASSGSGGSGGTPSRAAAPASGMAASGSALKTTAINGATVLTNAKGFTLYSFAPDTPNISKCNGSCAHFWPPVTPMQHNTSAPARRAHRPAAAPNPLAAD